MVVQKQAGSAAVVGMFSVGALGLTRRWKLILDVGRGWEEGDGEKNLLF